MKTCVLVGIIFSMLAAATAGAVTTLTLVPSGSVWKYLDNGSNQGTAWSNPAYDDVTWASGPAQLGYGNGDEATIVAYGPDPNHKYITTYFRRSFTVQDKSLLTGITLKLIRDDGAVVYLNGIEIFRSNMPAGTINYNTLANASGGNSWVTTTLDTSAFVNGNNVLAVEIHQLTAGSPDISFDLKLTAVQGPNLTRGPFLQLDRPDTAQLRWRTDVATDSQVKYGIASTDLNNTVTDPTITTEHAVTLPNLNSYTKYFYSVGSTAKTLTSGGGYRFWTPPNDDHPLFLQRIWALGDSGTGDANAIAVRNAYTTYTGSTYTNIMVMLGGITTNDGSDAQFQSAFFTPYSTVLRQALSLPSLNETDTAGDISPPLTIPYFSVFSLPSNGIGGGVDSGTPKYYSYNYAIVHYICLDSETSDRSPNGPMLTWLKQDLAANKLPWIIAFWHHAPYSKGSSDSDFDTQMTEMRQNALPILEDHGVDLVVAAHSNSYERSYFIDGHYGFSSTFTLAMIKNGGDGNPAGNGAYTKPAAAKHAGTVYVVTGSAGKILPGAFNHPAMFTSQEALGSFTFDILNTKLDAKFIRSDGVVADIFEIQKINKKAVVSITAPVNGQTFPAHSNITVSATASDPDGNVRRVRFFIAGNVQIASVNEKPYSFTWNNVAAGNYAITAKAEDDLGATTTSAPVNIVVQ